MNDKLASIGEKIGISKFERIDAEFVSSYIHGANRMGVLVGLNKAQAEAGKDIAMQIAAMNPVAVDPASVPAETVEREKAIVTDLIKNEVNNTKTEYYKNSNWFREKLIDKLVGSLKASISSVAFYVYTMLPDVK